MGVAETILTEALELPEGAVISAKNLLHLGTREAVDKALSRLHHTKKLMRIGHGLYVSPVESRFGVRAPATEKVVAHLAEINAETVAPHGAAAANSLGLTTQVPTKVIYYTSGPNRRIKLGAQVVELKHARNYMLLPGAGRAGEAVRALVWIGKQHANEALFKLKKTLSEAEVSELVARRPALPGWLSQSISKSLMQHG